MAEVLASLKKIGGNGEQYTETSLWTNPDPTSNFAGQTVTLSDNISNYKYIGVLFDCDVSASGQPRNTAIYSVADYKTTRYNGNTDHNICSLTFQGKTNNYMYTRMFYYVDDTHIGVSSGMNVQRTGGFDSACVPLQIIGINELAHGKKLPETVLWTNPNPNTNFDAQSVTLSDNISNYDFICVEFDGLSDRPTPRYINRVVFYVEDFKTYAYSGGTTHRVGLTGFQIDTSNYSYARFVYYVDDTHVGFSTGYSINRVANTTAVTPPIRIIGIKVG